MSIHDLDNDFEKANYLQNLLINHSTGNAAENEEYQELRHYFQDNPATKSILPAWVRTNRDLSQFWNFIKMKFSTYKERRDFIWKEFSRLLDYLEAEQKMPSDQSISDVLERFDAGVFRLFGRKPWKDGSQIPRARLQWLEHYSKLFLNIY